VNVLDGAMMPVLLKLAWPAAISMLLQTIYNIIDTFWLGKLGPLAISAPTIAWNIIFMFISVGSGLSTAGLALVAQFFGAKEHGKVEFISGQIMSITFIISVVLAIFGGFSSEWILKAINIPVEMIPLTAVYMKTILFGLPFTFLMFAITAIFSGMGDTFTPMVLTTISVVANALLDPLLIFGVGIFPELGVFGAALATVVTRGLVIIIAIVMIFRGRLSYKIHLKDLVPRIREVIRILKIGMPSSFGQVITAFAFVIITSMIAQYGAVATSAIGVGNRISSFATMFSFGIAQATSTMVGQYLGAKRKRCAYKVVWKSAFLTVTMFGAMSALMFFFGKELTGLFIQDPAVMIEGQRYFAIVSLSLPFFACFNIFDSGLRGSGHTVQSMTINIMRLWVIRLPIIYLLGESIGLIGIWYALFISNIAVCILAAIVIMRKKWLTPVIKI